MKKRVSVLVGSLRAQSINRKFAQALEKLSADHLEFDYVDIGALPHYNEELWTSPPKEVLELKQRVEDSDGVLFVTPEYNRTVPGVLINALDWGSRPYSKSSWAGKPTAVVGTSPGALGAAIAQTHLRSVLTTLNMAVMGQPEIYIKMTQGLLDDNHDVTDPALSELLTRFLATFDTWIGRQRA